jgi:hypothetical protein
MSVVQSHQLDIGVNPGQVPVFSDIGTLPLGADPVNDTDAVTLRYVKHLFKNVNILNNIEISNNIDSIEKQLLEFHNQVLKINNNISILQKQFPSISIPTDLIEYKNYIKTEINQLVSNARIKYISNTLGQSDVYKEKVDQAIDYLLQTEPIDIALFPLVRIDSEVYNISYQEAAENIIQQKKIWMQYTCSIEKLRLIVKKEVDLAPSIEYIDNLIEQFILDLNKL